MKKIMILLMIALMMSLPLVAMADTNEDGLMISTETVQTDDNGFMALIYTTTSYFFEVLNIDVKKVEAVVRINISAASYKNYKILIEKDDTEYIYNLVEDVEYFPLQMGSGKYNVTILGSNDGRRFRLIGEQSFNVELVENAVFLSSSQTVNWDAESKVAQVALEITDQATTDQERLEVIHTYVVDNVRYDYDKANALPKGYIPSPISTIDEGLGICYDFAALMASMLRSVDIPTKLIKGYSSYTPVYHAWNEVLIEEDWLVVDASTDSIYVDYKVKYVLSKSAADYVMSKEY
jgi:transglutaminase-like putative cysteine protease